MTGFSYFFSYSFICFLAYLVGAIPTGYIFAKLFFNVTITEAGSGNIGASNIGRVLGKKYFLLVFFLDACKAYGLLAAVATLSPDFFGSFWVLWGVVFTLLIGNAYSFFLGFKGGKGVATIAGILAFIAPWTVFVLFALLWLGVLAISKEPFLASITALLSVFVWFLFFGSADLCWLSAALFVWALLRHKNNIIQSYQKQCSTTEMHSKKR
jgi:glycerol-3-phosphate acyltransferase PlsY